MKIDAQVFHVKSNLLKGILYFLIFALGFPLVYLVMAFSLDIQLENPWHPHYLMVTIGTAVGVAGLYVIVYTTIELIKKGRGLPLSSSPPKELVRTGPYRWSRHPVYAGTIILVTGLFIWRSSFWGLVLSLPMLVFFYLSYAGGLKNRFCWIAMEKRMNNTAKGPLFSFHSLSEILLIIGLIISWINSPPF